jgi:NitT/TauT family transport system substrate-binding protein
MIELMQAYCRAGLGLLLAIAASSSFAQEALKMRMDFIPYALHAPFHYAKEQGWYKQQGIDLTIEDGSGSVATVLMVGAGSYDLGFANISTMASGRAKGAKVVAIAGIIHRNDMALFVDKKYGVKEPKEVITRNIPVIYLTGGFMSPFVGPFMKRAGATDPSKLQIVSIAGGAYISQYLAGEAGGLLTTAPYMQAVLDRVRPSDVFMFSDYGLEMPAFGLITSEDVLKSKADAIRRFLAVSSRVWKQAWAGNGAEMIDAMIKARPQTKLDAQLEMARLAAYQKLAVVDEIEGRSVLWQAQATWDKFFKIAVESGIVPPDANPAQYYTNSYLPSQ